MADHSLLHELKQKKPFPSAREEAFVALLRTADMLRWRGSEVLAPEDLSATQFNVLRILRGAGEAGLPTLDIGARLVEQAPGITRHIDRLEARGLVRRERVAKDRRQVLCHIEPAGLRLLERLEGPVAEATTAIFSGLKTGEIEALLASLAVIRRSCAATCPSLKKH